MLKIFGKPRRLRLVGALVGLLTIGMVITDVDPIHSQTIEQVGANARQNEILAEIKDIQFKGNTIFDDEELSMLVASFKGEKMTYEKLLSLRTKITDFYTENGYTTTSATVAVRNSASGIVEIEIVEAVLSDLQIEGASKLNKAYLYSRLPKVGNPLNQQELVNSLARLRDDPMIEEIEADLAESSAGENVINLKVKETSPFQTQFALSNTFSPSVGTLGGSAKASYHLFGYGDKVNFGYTRTEGLERFDAGYSIKLNPQNTQLSFAFAAADTEIIEDPISALDIQGDYQAIQLTARQPVPLSPSSEIIFTMQGDFLDSDSFIETVVPFGFVDGLPDGESNISALRLIQEYFTRNGSSSLGIRSNFNVGLPIFGATETEIGIDGLFWSWQGQAQYLKRLNSGNLTLSSRLNVQLTPDQLLPIEQLTLGGFSTVRGYRQNLSIGDNGVIGSVELKIPIVGTPESHFFSLFPFVNAGTIWNNSDEEIPTETLASVGIGASYQLRETIEARVDLALPLIEANAPPDFETEQEFTFQLLVRP